MTELKSKRAARTNKQSREVLLTPQHDEWVNKHMQGKWSRNAVIENCIEIAMGHVEQSAVQAEAITKTLTAMQTQMDTMAHQLRMLLAIANFDAKLQYMDVKPLSYADHALKVKELADRMGGKNDSAQ